MKRPLRAIDLTPKGFCSSSAIRKRARDATFSASRSSSESSLADSTFTAGKPIYVYESDGALHPGVFVSFCDALLTDGRKIRATPAGHIQQRANGTKQSL